MRNLDDIQRFKAQEIHAADEAASTTHEVLDVQEELSLACNLRATHHAVHAHLPAAQEP